MKKRDGDIHVFDDVVETQYFTFAHPPNELVLESGEKLGPITLAYETYGKLNVGFGKAVALARERIHEEAEKLALLREKFLNGLFESVDHVYLNGHPTQRLPNNINVSVKYVDGESMLLNLDMEAIAASAGSACSSSSLEPSHVLLALGRPREPALGSLRFILGRYTTEEELEAVLEIFPKIVKNLRALSPLYKELPQKMS